MEFSTIILSLAWYSTENSAQLGCSWSNFWIFNKTKNTRVPVGLSRKSNLMGTSGVLTTLGLIKYVHSNYDMVISLWYFDAFFTFLRVITKNKAWHVVWHRQRQHKWHLPLSLLRKSCWLCLLSELKLKLTKWQETAKLCFKTSG